MSSGSELSFWDHLTLLGALGVVVGYIVFRIRIALNPEQGGCGCGCDSSECGPAASSRCSPPAGVIKPSEGRSAPP